MKHKPQQRGTETDERPMRGARQEKGKIAQGRYQIEHEGDFEEDQVHSKILTRESGARAFFNGLVGVHVLRRMVLRIAKAFPDHFP